MRESIDHLLRLHGFTVDELPVDVGGRVSPADLATVIRPDTSLVSIQYANNEVGTVQPIAELAAIARAAGAPFHTDAVQAAGWLPLHIDMLGVDALSLAGHKVGAPKGIGALVVRGRVPLEPLLNGGGQERARRSGTENVAGAVAFATALTLAESERMATAARVRVLRDRFVAAVLDTAPTARLTGDADHRLPGTASFVFPGTSGEAVLLELERRGLICSSGSACAAGSDEASPVLLALGLSAEVAQTAVRFSFGGAATEDDLKAAAVAVGAAVLAVAGDLRLTERAKPEAVATASTNTHPCARFCRRRTCRPDRARRSTVSVDRANFERAAQRGIPLRARRFLSTGADHHRPTNSPRRRVPSFRA